MIRRIIERARERADEKKEKKEEELTERLVKIKKENTNKEKLFELEKAIALEKKKGDKYRRRIL